MSLTNQLKDKNSAVRRFFEKHGDLSAMRWCLALDLQSEKPILPLSYEPKLKTAYSFMGTTTDYLLRYTLQGNTLRFEDSFAYKAVQSRPTLILWQFERIIKPEFFYALFEIGKFYLDGRNATENEPVYSATALAVLEHYFRSGNLPEALLTPISEELADWVSQLDGKNQEYKVAWYFFDVFYQSLGGDDYAQDVGHLVKLFSNEISNPDSSLYKAQIKGTSQSLANSSLVGGADFDCVIECGGLSILTDIKTTKEPLSIAHLQQLLGYALLHDPEKDDFEFSDIGFYLSRAASFRHLSLERVVKTCLPKFKDVSHAREVFVREIKNA